ncbi:phosphorylated carbohydrates phosphatase [Anaerotignum neopropionicum]|uniref:Phosphorylated carbohydrates phosphatase n=1 Tax=Anaerotignum neopropionicum TaxID=36847 RepID=A0A136WFT5_9FIRM|nr:HAD family phosphatase [Anaerotignum neopropionicum]KXL53365.1 phosphorylated carbohydrates phosphatase [Anaerotignum neopropionicum]
MKSIIFDLDGTLIDSMPVWKNTGRNFLLNHGFAVPENLHSVVKAQTIGQTAEYFRKDLGVTHTPEEIINEIIQYVEDAYKNTIPLKPYAKEFLDKELENGTKMCVLTASEASYIHPALERLDLIKYFQFILTCTETGHYKTDPQVFRIAMEKLGGNLENTIVFEDALYAVEGAKKGGFTVYAVADPVTEADSGVIRAVADKYIKSYKELL